MVDDAMNHDNSNNQVHMTLKEKYTAIIEAKYSNTN
jgi:hypothetical protein